MTMGIGRVMVQRSCEPSMRRQKPEAFMFEAALGYILSEKLDSGLHNKTLSQPDQPDYFPP